MSNQQPPADELFAVRTQIAALEAREAELRQILLSDPSTRTGNLYVATPRQVETQRTDIKELRAMHPELAHIFDEHTFPAKITRIELSAIDQETGELTSVRRKPPVLRTIRVV